jgi:hypothetical protein
MRGWPLPTELSASAAAACGDEVAFVFILDQALRMLDSIAANSLALAQSKLPFQRLCPLSTVPRSNLSKLRER